MSIKETVVLHYVEFDWLYVWCVAGITFRSTKVQVIGYLRDTSALLLGNQFLEGMGV